MGKFLLQDWEDRLYGIPTDEEWERSRRKRGKIRRQAKTMGLPDPTQSQWHRDRWKRRRKRWNRKLLGIRPSDVAVGGALFTASQGWDIGSQTWDPVFEPSFLMLGTAGATIGWKALADKANRQKRKWRAHQRRKVQRRRREMEKIASQHPTPTRERRSEPPFYTDSPT